MEVSKWMVAFVAIFNFGGVLADAIIPATAAQHLFNPRWRPHAKFHNCQTMLMGIFGGMLSLAILFGSEALTLSFLLIAAAVAGNYFFAMTFATVFPGTAWTDPEFVATTAGLHRFAPQQVIAYALSALTLVAMLLAVFMR